MPSLQNRNSRKKRQMLIKNNRKNMKLKRNKLIIRNYIIAISIFLIIGVSINYIELFKREVEIETRQKVSISDQYDVAKTISSKQYNVEGKIEQNLVEKEYMNEEVCAMIEIPKIKLKSNILKNFSTQNLDKCITKFYGANPNEKGNFVIAGHNYNKADMFNKLINLEKQDIIFLTDNLHGKKQYIVKEIYKVEHTNLEPIKQNMEEIQITLLTCINFSNKRLIVQAQLKS